MRPVHAFFRVFDRGFDALARRLCAAWCAAWRAPGSRCWSATCALLVFAGWFVQRLPTGFIPSLDRAILIISIQLPPGASLERTDAVVRQATDIAAGDAGRQIFQRLHRPQRRDVHGRHQRRPAVPGARRLRGAARDRGRRSTRSPQDAARQARADRGGADAGVHPAAGARHGRGGRLLDAAAGHARHAGRPSSRASRRSSSPRPTARPASPTSSRPSQPPRRRCSSTSTATRRRC